MKKSDLHDEIAETAYYLYEKRGRVHGHAKEDWIEAERIVNERYASTEEKAAPRVSKTTRKTAATAKPDSASPAKRGRKPAKKKE